MRNQPDVSKSSSGTEDNTKEGQENVGVSPPGSKETFPPFLHYLLSHVESGPAFSEVSGRLPGPERPFPFSPHLEIDDLQSPGGPQAPPLSGGLCHAHKCLHCLPLCSPLGCLNFELQNSSICCLVFAGTRERQDTLSQLGKTPA